MIYLKSRNGYKSRNGPPPPPPKKKKKTFLHNVFIIIDFVKNAYGRGTENVAFIKF